jgi:hypothetical protein
VHAAVDMVTYRGAKRPLLIAIFEAAPKQTEDWIIGETLHNAETSGDSRAALRTLAKHAVGPDHQDVNRCAKRLEDASANLP